MKLHQEGNTLCVSDVPELGLANAEEFAAELQPALATGAENVIIDLSSTRFVDCGGLGALVALRNKVSSGARHRLVHLNLVNPTPPVRQLLRLTHFDHLLESSASGINSRPARRCAGPTHHRPNRQRK
jgi:anti-anti-sigma factor